MFMCYFSQKNLYIKKISCIFAEKIKNDDLLELETIYEKDFIMDADRHPDLRLNVHLVCR